MPELPEVENVRLRLAQIIVGRRITDVQIDWGRSIDRPAPKNFLREIIGKSFLIPERRGKYLILPLQPSHFLLAHLRMSGDLYVSTPQDKSDKHIRVKFTLDDGQELRFHDTRKFGRLYLVTNPDEIVGKLGPEPLSQHFTLSAFSESLKKKQGAIKPLLLNQQFLAGLGNIYVVESLWHSGVHPLKPSDSLSAAKEAALFAAIKSILAEAVEKSGTDIGDGVWKTGGFVTKAYGREGTPCERCGTTIKRIVVGQRGTEFCPKCQRE